MEATIKPRIGQACSLSRAHVANVTLVFFYVELVKNGNWQEVERQTPLSEGVHYSLDTAKGQVTLLDDPLWQTMGHYRAADREDTLLYKGRVTAPQRIVAIFDAYIPTEVAISVDKTAVSDDDLTITVEGSADVPVAIYSDGSRVGSLVVNGSHVMSVGANVPRGKYSLEPDRTVLDLGWNLPQFSGQGASVEVIDA
jgi:hypothetical protein